MEDYLIANGFNFDGTLVDNKIAKALASSSLWNSSLTPEAIGNAGYATVRNKSGFSGLPGGYRLTSGFFSSLGANGVWWTSTIIDEISVWTRELYYDGYEVYRTDSFKIEPSYSVRCISD